MKCLILLFIPFLLFSQTIDYPDTVYLKSGKIHPCVITQINDNFVKIIYKNNFKSSAALNAIDKIVMEQFELVYNEGSFQTDTKLLNEFVSNRNENYSDLTISHKPSYETKDEYNDNKWSFGVQFVPYYYGDFYYQLYDPYGGYFTIIIFGRIESVFESQFAVSLNPNLSIIFDVGYASSYLKIREENHSGNNSGNSNSSGNEEIDDMDVFALNIGFKYYFKQIFEEKVSAYLQAGIGKQFAFVDNEERELFRDPINQSNYRDNTNEYLEDLNSPLQFYFGFGTEYFFNQYLSLNANLRFIYSTISAERERKYSDQGYYDTDIYKIENSNLIKRVSLGLNFYF